jgi:Zn-dependent peptidase ImmA (M78 family)
MQINKKLLATEAMAKALRLRKRIGVALNESVSAFDAASVIGIDVRFVDIPSMEGMYVAGNSPTIMLSSLRPQGRRNFTCAHEIGHHEYGHGEQFDELVIDKSNARNDDPCEFSADCFAGYFLMPKATIENGLVRRGFSYSDLTPIQTYMMASWLGVGYSTLINHLRFSLGTMTRYKADSLQQHVPRDIRHEILGQQTTSNLHIADTNWVGRAIDCEKNDYLIVPPGTTLEGDHCIALDLLKNGLLLQATTPGISRVTNLNSGWASFVRVAPSNYTGRSCYRFEEEVSE